MHTPLLGELTRAIAHSAAKWSSAKNKKSHLEPQDDTMVEMRARQKMIRKQATLRCKEATQLGAPSLLKGPPPPTIAPMLERVDESGRTEKVEHLDGRTDTVHKHCKQLFTDHSHAVILELIEQRWPYDILLAFPVIDGARVHEVAFEFRKRTSCWT